ncbi:hypothetical protein GCM10009117_15280 [Gangjinia marincola]|uniref:DUF4397 domain-containing protein n=2 Tax=Gangjinia marincola TaxID=578463 RepID=A0ABP3XSV9_9FLAO
MVVVVFSIFSVGAQQTISSLGDNNPKIFTNLSVPEFDCGQSQFSNAFQNGLNITAGGQFQQADDFSVAAGDNIDVNNIIVNLFNQGGISSVDIVFYDDAGGSPGTQIGTVTGIVPTDQTVVGSNFGFDISAVTLDFAPQTFVGGASYWVELIGTPTVSGNAIFWEVTDASVNGNAIHGQDSGGGWIPQSDANSGQPYDGVWILSGDCDLAPNDEPDGAIALSCGANVTGTIVGANDTAGGAGPDVFYTYTGQGFPEDITVSLCGDGTDYDSRIRIYDDITLANEIAVNDDFCGLQSEVTFNSDGATTYYILVGGFGTSEGNFELDLICPTPARAQIIHNSADAAAAVVDVYGDDVLLIDDFEFRTASPFVELPAGVQLTLGVAPSNSTSSSDAIYTLDVTLDADETYIVVADGIVSDTGYSPDQDFSLEVFAMAREAAASSGNTDVLVHHGSTDAPTVDVVETSVPAGTIVDDISYPEFQGYLELGTADYVLDVTTADGSTVVASYEAPLATLGLTDAAITVLASGFLDPSQNSDGAEFGLWVALAQGGPLVELPLIPPPPACGGKFYDTGGPNGDFDNNEDYDITILPDNAGDIVTATFTFVDNGPPAFDQLFVDIGDGNLQQVPNVAAGDPPVVYTSVAADGSLFFSFTSTGVVPNPGWEADITCSAAPARVQVIHNSPDPDAQTVDVYLNDDLLLDDFQFRTATSFIDAPAGVPLTIDVAPGDSDDSGDSIFELTVTLDSDETYIIVADGVVTDPDAGEEFSLEVFTGARETGTDPANTDVLVHHGSPDAPTVDVVETSVPAGIIVDDISYTDFQGYLSLPTADYTVSVTTADGATEVAAFSAPLATLGQDGAAITVLASGFLAPEAGEPEFGLWVALATGGNLIALPTAPLSINGNTIEGVSVYPVPASDVLNIRAQNNVEQIEIFNLLGQRVFMQKAGSTTASFDISELSAGNYILRATIGGQIGNYQIIKK